MNASSSLSAVDRRVTPDRRRQKFRALLFGSFRPRRRYIRRQDSTAITALDWHSSKWFAVALLILTLSLIDTLLTLVLLDQGAIEVNPVMRYFIFEGGRVFALSKLGMTAGCITLLILTTRSRAFGRSPAGPILYLTALIYAGLVTYELWLLDALRLT
jgi:hypothetical protein